MFFITFHGRIQRGTGGPDTLPLKNHKNIGFLSNELLSLHSMLGHHRHASETPFKFNGVSLAGRWWPAFISVWIISPLINYTYIQKKVVQFWPPLTKLSGSTHAFNATITTVIVCFPVCWNFKVSLTNSVDQDQTDTVGAVWSGSTLFQWPLYSKISQ